MWREEPSLPDREATEKPAEAEAARNVAQRIAGGVVQLQFRLRFDKLRQWQQQQQLKHLSGEPKHLSLIWSCQ